MLRVARFSEGNHSLRGVEIFAAGEHRGKPYTREHLNEIVRNFEKYSSPRVNSGPKLRVPAVLGHEEEQEFLDRSDLPAAGWPDRVYVRDKRQPDGSVLPVLAADFDELPDKIARLIKGRAYRTVSAEIYDSPPQGIPGKGKMLRRIAFLGGDIPQVKTLDDIPTPEAHAERGSRYIPVVTKFRESRRSIKNGTFWIFSEVQPMDRQAMIAELAKHGVDTSAIDDKTPDPVLAEMLRSHEAKDASKNDDDSMYDEEPPEPKDDEEKKKFAERCKKMAAYSAKGLKKYDDNGGKTDAQGKDGPSVLPEQTNKQLADQHREIGRLNVELTKLKTQQAEITRFNERTLADAKRSNIKQRLDDLVKAGKVDPSERDSVPEKGIEGLDKLAERLDSTVVVHRFKENGKEIQDTALDAFFRHLEARPPRRFSERFKDPKGAPNNADKAKIERFCEAEDGRYMKLAGTTKADFIASYDKQTDEQKAQTLRDIDAGLKALGIAA